MEGRHCRQAAGQVVGRWDWPLHRLCNCPACIPNACCGCLPMRAATALPPCVHPPTHRRPCEAPVRKEHGGALRARPLAALLAAALLGAAGGYHCQLSVVQGDACQLLAAGVAAQQRLQAGGWEGGWVGESVGWLMGAGAWQMGQPVPEVVACWVGVAGAVHPAAAAAANAASTNAAAAGGGGGGAAAAAATPGDHRECWVGRVQGVAQLLQEAVAVAGGAQGGEGEASCGREGACRQGSAGWTACCVHQPCSRPGTTGPSAAGHQH